MRYKLIQWFFIGITCFYSCNALSFFDDEDTDEDFNRRATHVVSTLFGIAVGSKISCKLYDWIKPQNPVAKTVIWIAPSALTIWAINEMIKVAIDSEESKKEEKGGR